MKISRAWFVPAAIIWGLAFPAMETAVHAATPRPVSVAHPSGGEVFIMGSQLQIRLNRKPRYPQVRIELSRDGGGTFELLGTVDNTARPASLRRKLDWAVTGPASENCVLRVTGIRRGVDVVSSLGQPFSINAPTGSGSPADHGGLLGLLDDDHPQYLRADGTRALTGHQSAGGNKITNMAAPTANTDGATKQYVDNETSKLKSSGSGNPTLPIAFAFVSNSGTKSSGTSNVSSTWDAVNKRYEITIAGVNYVRGQFITLVTATNGTSANASTDVAGAPNGKLYVRFNLGGTFVQREFQFVTFRP